VNARAIRAAVGAADNLRTLLTELALTGSDLDAQLIHHCGEVVQNVLGRIVTGRTEPVEQVH
jgi:hypothetical protein